MSKSTSYKIIPIVSQLFLKDWILIAGLVFGGCCSNVFTLEKIITKSPDSGNALTFIQFIFGAVGGYVNFFDKKRPPFYVKKNKVPMKEWGSIVLMYSVIPYLNNLAFSYNISIPVHITIRSSGTAVTMLIGWLVAKKKYNHTQIISALILTLGSVITALYKDQEFLFSSSISSSLFKTISFNDTKDFNLLIGFTSLTVVAVILALMGLQNENIYRKYGKHWRENLFYSNLLGLPILFLFNGNITSEFKHLWNDPETFNIFGQIVISKQVVYLMLNVFTQCLCINGANMLASNTSALTVSVVLLLRKFMSLLLSIYLFNNKLSKTGIFGAILVFSGAFLYSIGSTTTAVSKKKRID